ncbi:FAD/NAD(P)-binding domain-containing protein [Coniophora puteana RWD-64-598 SS2]|uniref:Protoporphyrinogen oxidase n=1 Tax=Coniophora puteana (strain RWD-64-598) TaxID=741705 RepID=A0A5M3MHG0_CONPW|nr:FAD/NAD(P)-binding domain-containing protein [Coniophora puteana RWD-64-598 SS2]EIW78446.1 FAD/NAD(P)-binding domain-containing protein [Coniophora puteana RWD-64-598 SS2]
MHSRLLLRSELRQNISIAILGGGITGLSSAYYLNRRFPNARITLLESNNRFGGWIQSSRHDVPLHNAPGQCASVLLESGPRTLRPVSKPVLELINLLGLQEELLIVPRDTPAAKNRFLHLPGTTGLVRLPSSMASALASLPSSPVIRLLARQALAEAFRPANSKVLALEDNDESMDDLLARRLGPEAARIFGSAMIHGIYAADSRGLSVAAAFPMLAAAEKRGQGSLVRGMFIPASKAEEGEVYELGDVQEMMKGASVFTFREGIGALVSALTKDLKTAPQVEIHTGVQVSGIRPSEDGLFEISTPNSTLTASHVVSALPLPALASSLSLSPTNQHQLTHLTANTASNVAVLNLVFPASHPALQAIPPGFGYLVPRPEAGYATSPPSDTDPNAVERAILGCVFDSCSSGEQDASPTPIVKLTVMLGGPHPLPPALAPPPGGAQTLSEALDPRSELTAKVLRALERQLGIGKELPVPIQVVLHRHRDAIPTYRPGHVSRMKELQEALDRAPWNGRLAVVGAGVSGVSVGSCVQAGREVGRRWDPNFV